MVGRVRTASRGMYGLEVKPALQVYQAESVRSLLLDSQLTGAPGRFVYNNVAFHLGGLVAERASRLPLHELAGRGLFEPLGVQEWDWQVDPQGFPLCMAGLWMYAPDLARVASLHLTTGQAVGRQVAIGVDGRVAPIGAGRGWAGLLRSVLRRRAGSADRVRPRRIPRTVGDSPAQGRRCGSPCPDRRRGRPALAVAGLPERLTRAC